MTVTHDSHTTKWLIDATKELASYIDAIVAVAQVAAACQTPNARGVDTASELGLPPVSTMIAYIDDLQRSHAAKVSMMNTVIADDHTGPTLFRVNDEPPFTDSTRARLEQMIGMECPVSFRLCS